MADSSQVGDPIFSTPRLSHIIVQMGNLLFSDQVVMNIPNADPLCQSSRVYTPSVFVTELLRSSASHGAHSAELTRVLLV